MSKKKNKQKRIYYADFETTSYDPIEGVRVYLWVFLRGNEVHSGTDISTFMDEIRALPESVMYFHNLKFDFSYIQYYIIQEQIPYTILERKGMIYSVKVYDVEFRDSLNFLNISLKEVGDNYCTKYKKTSIDYAAPWDHVPTDEEVEYCINDCRVLEEGLTNYLEELRVVLNAANACNTASALEKKLTKAGIAFEAFRELSNFDQCCPKTTQSEFMEFREAYRGGYVYSRGGGIVSNIQMIDNNSMYPYIYSTIDMPVGKHINCTSIEDCRRFKFYIVKISIKYDLREGYIPILGGGVSRYGGINYKTSSDGEFEEHTFCNLDLDLIMEFYDCEIEFLSGFGWETCPEFFMEYATVFGELKKVNVGIRRQAAKDMLNSPYGKLGMNGVSEIKEWFIDEEHGIVKSRVTGYEVDDGMFKYLPGAIQVTAGARHLLLTTARDIGFENVYYMDTDSIKFKKPKVPPFEYDDKTLGKWKDEGVAQYFKTIAPKKYAMYCDGKLSITCAGFNKKTMQAEMCSGQEVEKEKALEIMRSFDKGLSLTCLQSHLVKGGRALTQVAKEVD